MKITENSILKRKTKSISTFLKKTYDILQNPENNIAIKWSHNGIGFIVANQEYFSKEILPRYFKHSNYSSFVRQLNMYNFHKIRQGNSESFFYHELFDRHDMNAIAEIKRKPQKKKRKVDETEQQLDDQVSIYNRKKNQKITQSKRSLRDGTQKKLSLQNTLQLVCSEHDAEGKGISKNILSMELDDDRLSINEQMNQRCPRFQTRQLIYPSNHMIPYNYPAAQLSNFSLIL